MNPSAVFRYAEVVAPLALRERVQCTWQFRQGSLDLGPAQVLPDGCVDLIWNGSSLMVAATVDLVLPVLVVGDAAPARAWSWPLPLLVPKRNSLRSQGEGNWRVPPGLVQGSMIRLF